MFSLTLARKQDLRQGFEGKWIICKVIQEGQLGHRGVRQRRGESQFSVWQSAGYCCGYLGFRPAWDLWEIAWSCLRYAMVCV